MSEQRYELALLQNDEIVSEWIQFTGMPNNETLVMKKSKKARFITAIKVVPTGKSVHRIVQYQSPMMIPRKAAPTFAPGAIRVTNWTLNE